MRWKWIGERIGESITINEKEMKKKYIDKDECMKENRKKEGRKEGRKEERKEGKQEKKRIEKKKENSTQ